MPVKVHIVIIAWTIKANLLMAELIRKYGPCSDLSLKSNILVTFIITTALYSLLLKVVY